MLTSGVGLAGLLISPLFFPSILYGMPRIPGASPADTRPKPSPAENSDPLSWVPEERHRPGFESG